MKLVVAAVSPTPILWWRASGLVSPMEVPASTLPARGMAPVRANIASRSVVLPLWKGPTNAMHRGPRGLLTSCPIAASSSGARPLIGSAALMVPLHRRFGKPEKRRCGASQRAHQILPRMQRNGEKLPPRSKFQAFQAGRDAEADLALDAERLQRDRIRRAADQHVAADPDADRRAALRAGVIAREIAGPEPRHRRVHAPGQRRFLGDAEIEADLADGRDITVLRHAFDAQHATEIGHGANDEADAGAAAAFEDADLHALHRLLRMGADEEGDQDGHGHGDTGKDERAAHEENLRLKRRDAGKESGERQGFGAGFSMTQHWRPSQILPSPSPG